MINKLETERLILRFRSESDIKKMIQENSVEDQLSYFGYEGRPELLEKEIERIDLGYDNWKTTFHGWDLILKSNQRVIGSCGFHSWYKPHLRAEIGYGLSHEQFKNKGYMTEAMDIIMDHGFSVMGLNRIEAFVSPDNVPSIKLMQRYGFVKEGVLREHYQVGGKLMDSVAYAVLKADYLKLK